MIKAVLKGFTQKQEFVLFAILVVICTVFTIIAPFFLSAYNIGNLLRAVSMIVIVACGGTLLMMTANFDLSTGGNLIFSNIIFAMTCLAGVPVVFALGITIVCGCVIGALNGILVTRFSVTPFIATLGTWFIFKGLCHWCPKRYPGDPFFGDTLYRHPGYLVYIQRHRQSHYR
jgi:ribose/xylose/arabinose/galactoside ABC-type transport system permease subunit